MITTRFWHVFHLQVTNALVSKKYDILANPITYSSLKICNNLDQSILRLVISLSKIVKQVKIKFLNHAKPS